MDTTDRLVLRAKIKGLAAEGVRLGQRARATTRARRAAHRRTKSQVGAIARYHLLAYGLLRGVPYAAIERPRADHAPDPARLARLVHEHGGWNAAREWPPERVRAWLAPALNDAAQPAATGA